MIYIDYEAPGGITDVGFVYTAATGDDTPHTLEVPAHNPGDFILVFARCPPSEAFGSSVVGKNSLGVTVQTLTTLDNQYPSFVTAHKLSWGIDTDGDVSYVEHVGGTTIQIAIHVYRGVTGIGDWIVSTETLDNFGGDIPALTLDVTDGTSRVACGVNFNQLKDGASTPSTPAGMTKRLTSPSSLGGGTFVSYDTTEGVTSFPGARVDAFGGAYYTAWAVEMKN